MAINQFPGREAVLERLQRLRSADKLGQPLLFTGPVGTGKETTALEFARLLNCAAPDSCIPASRCESCVKALSFQHPDIRWIGPAPASVGEDDIRRLFDAKTANPFHQAVWSATAAVSIGDPDHPGPLTVRSLIHFLRRRAFQSPWKVAVIADGQRLNAAAANAFLKTLEEPPPRTVIMLLTTGTEGMLPTILSRCQKVRFDPWPVAQLASLLETYGAADPATALRSARAADGNARRAMAMLEPGARVVAEWAARLFAGIQACDRAQAALAADCIHRGSVPEACLPAEMTAKQLEAKEPAARRQRAILLCESLNLLYSDAVGRREAAADWTARRDDATAAVDAAARTRSTGTLLEDMALIDAAGGDIDRNLNIGLVMAVLFEGLIEHARRDQTQARSGRG